MLLIVDKGQHYERTDALLTVFVYFNFKDSKLVCNTLSMSIFTAQSLESYQSTLNTKRTKYERRWRKQLFVRFTLDGVRQPLLKVATGLCMMSTVVH